ncbi:NADH dehydrogenase ubiquinone Fe-S protein 4 [Limimaricola soesokkakensis]|nr:NADH dehydrogenase ubiquinone Fe-S protein 4 [Limimaricola soesokkakensis]
MPRRQRWRVQPLIIGQPRSSRPSDRALHICRTIPLNMGGNMERTSRLLPLAQMSLGRPAIAGAADRGETGAVALCEAPAVILYRPSRMPTQSGPAPRHWVLRIDPRHPHEREPRMGWVSDTDPDRQIELRFPSREAGLLYCRQRGWQPIVLPAQEREPVLKSNAERFVSERKPRSGPGHEARTDDARAGIEPLDEALIGSFPASDPPPLWADRIGPPLHPGDAAA